VLPPAPTARSFLGVDSTAARVDAPAVSSVPLSSSDNTPTKMEMVEVLTLLRNLQLQVAHLSPTQQLDPFVGDASVPVKPAPLVDSSAVAQHAAMTMQQPQHLYSAAVASPPLGKPAPSMGAAPASSASPATAPAPSLPKTAGLPAGLPAAAKDVATTLPPALSSLVPPQPARGSAPTPDAGPDSTTTEAGHVGRPRLCF